MRSRDNTHFSKQNPCQNCRSYSAETVSTDNGTKTWEWCRREEQDGIRFLNLEFLHECPEKAKFMEQEE